MTPMGYKSIVIHTNPFIEFTYPSQYFKENKTNGNTTEICDIHVNISNKIKM